MENLAPYDSYPKELFKKASTEDKKPAEITRPQINYWSDVWRRLKENKLAMIGLAIIIIMIVMSIAGPIISGYSYFEQDYTVINEKPDSTYWFGTDELGRDLFTRVWYGTRYSLLIGILATVIDVTIGVTYGGIAGMASGKLDAFMMRIAEIIYAIPYLLVVILLSVVFSTAGSGTSMFVIILALSLTSWVPMAILVRGQVLQLKQMEYCVAAQSLGASNSWLLKKHIIPNTLGPILVNVTLSIPRAIFAEATLGFMGLGLQAPKSSLGTLASDGLAGLAIGNGYQIIIPAVFISLIMFAFNVLGDGLRDALDPRLRK